MSDQVYLLNKNEGIDTLHTEHGPEACNRDDVEGRQLIDSRTARALRDGGYIRTCKHCRPFAEEETAAT